jgi:transcriptional regulator GlxA family with amidase domain
MNSSSKQRRDEIHPSASPDPLDSHMLVGAAESVTPCVSVFAGVQRSSAAELQRRVESQQSYDIRILIAIDYMEKHFQDVSLDLKRMSKVASLSCWHFSRLFKTQTGKGCRDYLRDVRLRHAEDLLRTTVLSIKEISWKVGYAYASDFDHHFKKRYGVCPRMFRKRRA